MAAFQTWPDFLAAYRALHKDDPQYADDEDGWSLEYDAKSAWEEALPTMPVADLLDAFDAATLRWAAIPESRRYLAGSEDNPAYYFHALADAYADDPQRLTNVPAAVRRRLRDLRFNSYRGVYSIEETTGHLYLNGKYEPRDHLWVRRPVKARTQR